MAKLRQKESQYIILNILCLL